MYASSSSLKYDVFLSFIGVDTRRTFVSHLYRSLNQNGIRTYKDENQEARDGRIPPEVSRAIEESNSAVVVISENYASSIWCLEVLATITGVSMLTIPVFYEVDPEDLRRLTGKFADDFKRHEGRENPDTVRRWRNALTRLCGNFTFCSRDWDDDSKMLDDLIIRISSAKSRRRMNFNLGHSTPAVSPYLISSGGTPQVSLFDASSSMYPWVARSAFQVSSALDYTPQVTLFSAPSMHAKSAFQARSGSPLLTVATQPSALPMGLTETSITHDNLNTSPSSPVPDDVNILLGMDRHKTAIYALLDLESKNHVRTIGIWGMEGVGKTTIAECVFQDISRHFQHHCFLTDVDDIHQNRISPSLLEHLTRTRSSRYSFDAIKPTLVNRNILLVVDGVHDLEQLKDIMKVSHWLGPGSRVIMTSKDQSLLVSCEVKYVYKVGCLRYEEAHQLFCQFAFKQDYPFIGFEHFSLRAVLFAGHLPLALKVLGSFLYGRDKESWKNALRRLNTSQDNCTREVSGYIGASEYIPRHRIELEQYIGSDEGESSPSYYMSLCKSQCGQ